MFLKSTAQHALRLFGCAGLVIAAAQSLPSQSASAQITIAPRFWYLIDGLEQGLSDPRPSPGGGVEYNLERYDPYDIPMYGASISYKPSDAVVITGTYLHGNDTSNATLVSVLEGDPIYYGGNRRLTKAKIMRDDLELSAQFPVNNYFGWLLGARYERAKVTLITTSLTSTNPPGGVVTTLETPGQDTYSIVSGRAGMTGSVPISSDGNHSFTATAMVFAGERLSDSARYENIWLAGPDVSVGYLVALTDRVTFDARYRAIFFFPASGDGNFGDPKATHGLNMSLAYRF